MRGVLQSISPIVLLVSHFPWRKSERKDFPYLPIFYPALGVGQIQSEEREEREKFEKDDGDGRAREYKEGFLLCIPTSIPGRPNV